MIRRVNLLVAATLLLISCSAPEAVMVDALPAIWPDYTFVTVPSTIAPLNFNVEGADRVYVTVQGPEDSFSVRGDYAAFPIRKWHRLLASSHKVTFSVKARIEGQWREFLPFTVEVSDAPIDESLVYRRIDPGYELYAKMGIYQRFLSTFNESIVFRNDRVAPGCVNCHSFAECDPSNAQLHFRGEKGGTLINGTIYNMKNELTLGTVYPYWHPSGRYIAYSANDIRQSFHNIPSKVLEVYDLASDVVVFDTKDEKLLVCPLLQDEARLETFPSFSPDGRNLYFCSADTCSDYRRIRYDICSVDFNPDDGAVGGVIHTLWHCDSLSAGFPRPSYDGRSLMFTVSDYGNFSIWHPEADLWIMDLQSGESTPASALNSEDTESYHSWSSTSDWVVFSSRRQDGRHTRLYIARSLGEGLFTKPFLLPQKDPGSNILLLQSYNIPEFCNGNFTVNHQGIFSSNRKAIKVELQENSCRFAAEK